LPGGGGRTLLEILSSETPRLRCGSRRHIDIPQTPDWRGDRARWVNTLETKTGAGPVQWKCRIRKHWFREERQLFVSKPRKRLGRLQSNPHDTMRIRIGLAARVGVDPELVRSLRRAYVENS
jgi:hypothetical protein